MNKTIRKIVALGMGASMLAGTAAMAIASDLSDYPSPFVKDGVFVGKIVIGEKASSVDVIGALDIAASLQRAASTEVASSGSSTTAVAADGYKFEENEYLIAEGTLASVITSLDDGELPDLLVTEAELESEDGSTWKYDTSIEFDATSTANVESDISLNNLDDKYEVPVVYFDLADGAQDQFYNLTIDFDDQWSPSDFQDNEEITLFGKEYSFDAANDNTDDVLTLFGSGSSIVVAKGESSEVTYMDKKYTVEVLGGNSDDSNAIVRINGASKTLTEGDSTTLGGLPVYVKDVFISNIGEDTVSVQLFVGSDKLELDVDGTVTLNGVDLDEATVYAYNGSSLKSGNWQDTDLIKFVVKPANAEDEVEYILPGEEYVDPVFGSFKFSFVGAEDLSEGKELIEFSRSSKVLNLEFTPRGASESTTVALLDNNAVDSDLWTGATLSELTEDKIFFYNEYSGEQDKAITHVLQVAKITKGNHPTHDDFEVVLDDLTFDKSYTVDSTAEAFDSKISLYAQQGDANNTIDIGTSSSSGALTYDATYHTIYTEAGAKIEFYNATGFSEAVALSELVNANSSGTRISRFLVWEDMDADTETSTTTNVTVTATWDSTDNEFNVAYATTFGGTSLSAQDDDDNNDHYLTQYGTYLQFETDDGGAFGKIYVPAEEVSYDMFVLPVDSDVTVTKASSSGAVSLNPISVGMAILDSEATVGSKPYIVVGGPCANTAAAALMDNPEDCAAGFTEGKAMIKLFSSKNALLVAGYDAKDTQGASRVVANYADYDFEGTELEVVTTNLNSLSVKKLS